VSKIKNFVLVLSAIASIITLLGFLTGTVTCDQFVQRFQDDKNQKKETITENEISDPSEEKTKGQEKEHSPTDKLPILWKLLLFIFKIILMISLSLLLPALFYFILDEVGAEPLKPEFKLIYFFSLYIYGVNISGFYSEPEALGTAGRSFLI